MTLEELYKDMGGNYEMALRVLRVERLIDKHIRKFAHNGVVDHLLEASKDMEPTQMFEAAHAAKGVCANLGLDRLSSMASEIAEEYRPGHARSLTDEEVAQKMRAIEDLYKVTVEKIQLYEGA